LSRRDREGGFRVRHMKKRHSQTRSVGIGTQGLHITDGRDPCLQKKKLGPTNTSRKKGAGRKKKKFAENLDERRNRDSAAKNWVREKERLTYQMDGDRNPEGCPR